MVKRSHLTALVVVAVLLLACIALSDAVQDHGQLVKRHRGNSTTTRVHRKHRTAPRLSGMMAFVINMRRRAVSHHSKLKIFFQKELVGRKKTEARLMHVVRRIQKEKKRQLAMIEKAKRELKKRRVLRKKQRKVLHRQKGYLRHLRSTRHHSNVNWNRTVSNHQHQAKGVRVSLKLVKLIVKKLKGPERLQDITALLHGQKTDDLSVNALLEVAVQASQKLGEGQRAEFKELIHTLKSDLVNHLFKLNKSIRASLRDRNIHLGKLNASITLVSKRVADARFQLHQNQYRIHDLKEFIYGTRNPLKAINHRLRKAKRKLRIFRKTMRREKSYFNSQSGLLKQRLSILRRMREVVKFELRNPNKATRQRLWSVTDIFPRPKYNWTAKTYEAEMPADLESAKNTRPINPFDLDKQNCGNWKFDESDGDSFALDSSKFAQDGKLHGSNLLRLKKNHNGKKGGLAFDGMDDYVDVGRLNNFGGSLNSFSIALWMKSIDQHESLSSLLKTVDDGRSTVVAIETNRRVGSATDKGAMATSKLTFEGGSLLVYLRDTQGKVLAGHVRAPGIFNNKWHHIQWTVVDAATNQMAVFIDGKRMQFVATIEQAPALFANLNRNLYIGAGNNRGTAEGFFDGAIDDVRLFCNARAPIYNKKCCLICTTKTRACGSTCIPQNQICNRPHSKGCACNLEDITTAIAPPLSEVIRTWDEHNAFGGRPKPAVPRNATIEPPNLHHRFNTTSIAIIHDNKNNNNTKSSNSTNVVKF